MCFSATTSLAAGTILCATGAVALKKAKTPPLKLFALTPLFFGVQQLSEAVVWFALNNPTNEWAASSLSAAVYSFLFFAWVLWPCFIPLFMLRLEKDVQRKKVLKYLLGIGIIVSSILIYVLINYEVWAVIENYHIRYDRNITSPYLWIFGIFYILPTVFSNFVSSVKWMGWLGVLNLLSYAISKVAFSGYIISVWCFFGAISSLLVLAIIVEAQREREDAGLSESKTSTLNF